MPTQTDLAGLGMPVELAAVLGNQPVAVTAAGSTQAGATAITTHLTAMTATGADGLILPSAAKIGTPYWIFNVSASTGLVYCPVGHTMNTTSNGNVSVATHLLVVCIQYSNKKWASILTA